MATDTALEHHNETEEQLWEGGKPPFKASYGKLMMWYFLLSDAFTFAGFLITYGTLRFSSSTWPVPDFVFSTAPFGIHDMPLIFVTIMSFLLIISSVTMVRAVLDGQRNNIKGVVFWMIMTIIGGLGFLGCQAWEWTNLIAKENMTMTRNPFGTHVEGGVYLDMVSGKEASGEDATFEEGGSYLIHSAEHILHEDHDKYGSLDFTAGSDHPGYYVDEDHLVRRKYKVTDGRDAGKIKHQELGPKAFGALFFFITGFHGFHVFSGVVFLAIIAINVRSKIYIKSNNGHEMVEKIGLYWHFVDLVWVFVFLVFYLL